MITESVYSVKEFGAIGDGISIDTIAVQKTIDCCAQNGGGTVLLAGGVFRCCTLYLKSNVKLIIDISARLKAISDQDAYPTDTHYNRYIDEPDMNPCFIYGEDLENVVIAGDGIIDGSGEEFPIQGGKARPMMIRLLRCKNIRIKGLRLKNSAAWTTAILDSENIWATDLDISAATNFNGDGLDFDGSKNIFISNCRIDGSDDNICLQASSREYAVKNVHISNCTLSSLCAGIRIGLKSVGDISNVVIQNCTFENVWREGIKIESSEGGTIENIMATNLVMHNVRRPIYILCNNTVASLGVEKYPEIGRLAGVSIMGLRITEDNEMKHTHRRFDRDVMGRPNFNGIRIDAEKNHKIESLTLEHIEMSVLGGVKVDDIPKDYPTVLDRREVDQEFCSGNYYPDWSRTAFMDVRNVKGLYLSDIKMQTKIEDERIPVLLEGCEDVVKDYISIKNFGNDKIHVETLI